MTVKNYSLVGKKVNESPVAVSKSTIVTYSDDLIICIPDGPHSFSSGRTDSGGNSFSKQSL